MPDDRLEPRQTEDPLRALERRVEALEMHVVSLAQAFDALARGLANEQYKLQLR